MSWYDEYTNKRPVTMQVDDVRFVQPIGFVWHTKPRYRIKCVSRRTTQEKSNGLHTGPDKRHPPQGRE